MARSDTSEEEFKGWLSRCWPWTGVPLSAVCGQVGGVSTHICVEKFGNQSFLMYQCFISSANAWHSSVS